MFSITRFHPRAVARITLFSTVAGLGLALAAWKFGALSQAAASAAAQPEPMETVQAITADEQWRRPQTSAIGTVVALRSISLRNELPGTVVRVALEPGTIVEAGTVLVALDTRVEQAELETLRAQAALAASVHRRVIGLRQAGAVSQEELERAEAEYRVAQARITRVEAVIARKTLKAPFRARVGLADVHPGQYLGEGALLTTLQGVSEGVHVDFNVAQDVAAQLREGDPVEVAYAGRSLPAQVVALDSQVNPQTRNARVRARIDHGTSLPAPGASVEVRVPTGPEHRSVTVPASALRRGPDGDWVFVIQADAGGQSRAHLRRVQVGAILGDEVVIDSGLLAGEPIVTTGAFKLWDSVLVAVAGPVLAQLAP